MRKTLYYWLIIMLLSGSILAVAQDNARSIKGIVTDAESGEPLIGVNVKATQSSIGTITNFEGKYTIHVSREDLELEFSFVGYSKKSIKIEKQTEVNVTLSEDIKSLNEIVVVGYGTQKKKDLTGAISVVDTKELGKRAVASLDQALQGQVAGVDVTSVSGSPGSNAMVRVRGIGTINNSDPLYVVDGMMVRDINFLNMNDIETVQVLKDASATAIYGSRGANGVIILTTKRGAKGQSVINVSAYYGVQNPWRSNNVCDGPTWGYLRNEMSVGLGGDILIQDPASLPTVNYFEEICQKNAPISSVDLSLSGGMEKGNYFFSINKFSQNGIIKKTGFDRVTVKANSDFEVRPWLKLGENFTMVKTNQKTQYENDEWTTPVLTSFVRDPVTPPRNEDGSFTRGIYNGIWNPLAVIEYDNPKSTTYRAIANMYAIITFLKDFTFKTNYSTEYSNNESSNYIPVYYVFAGQQNPSVNSLANSTYSIYIQQFTNTLTYEKSIGEHDFSAMIGGESYAVKDKSLLARVKDIPSDDPNVIFIDNAKTKDSNAAANGVTTETKQLSVLARVNYVYMDKYLLTANFRSDGSSKFVKGNRWGTFPSISLGWRVTEESFMKSFKPLDNLKLRAGWGQIGNEASVDAYSYATFASSGANYPFGGVLVPRFSFNSSGNKELKWEKTTTTNLGVDFDFFKSKLSGTIEFFNKITSDMLLRVPIPGQTGIMYAPFQNAGKMRNNGIEISLQYKNLDNPFTYAFGVNFSKINNKVLDLGTDDAFIDGASYLNTANLTRTVAGRPMAQFYGLKTDGLFQNWEEVNAQTAQTNVAPGDVKYVTVNKDDLFSTENFTFLGSPLPTFTYSFNANFGYKGFDLSCTLQGCYGNKVYNGPSIYVRTTQNVSYNFARDMIKRWTGEGTQNDAKYPRLGGSDTNNSIVQSDRYLEDGSYLRIKNMQFGYTIPSTTIKKIGLEQIRFYVNTQNLFTFTKYTGLDPEIGMRGGTDPFDIGVDRGYYPPARLFSVGLNVTL